MVAKGLLRLALLACLTPAVVRADEPNTLPAERAALSELQGLVGAWRGVGQPRRGSTRDAWTEQGDWAWQFHEGHAALVFTLRDARYYQAFRIAPAASEDGAAKQEAGWTLEATRSDGKTIDRFAGQRQEDGRLTFELGADQTGAAATRISLRTVADGDRLLILMEKPGPAADQMVRVAEVGYTREGSKFGKGVTQRECVVTGGAGTIAVEYEGETYYVCCGGCKDLFLEDPEKVLAEYRQRKEAEKQE